MPWSLWMQWRNNVFSQNATGAHLVDILPVHLGSESLPYALIPRGSDALQLLSPFRT
jgi:hypothetical protein